MTSKERKTLESLASTLEIKYQIGKSGLTNNAFDVFDKALTAHELIKVDVMRSVTSKPNELAFDLSSKLHATIVAIKGRTIILYRKNEDNPKIKL